MFLPRLLPRNGYRRRRGRPRPWSAVVCSRARRGRRRRHRFVFRGQDLDAVLASRDPQQPRFRERFLIVGRHRGNEPVEASGREIQDVKRRGQGIR